MIRIISEISIIYLFHVDIFSMLSMSKLVLVTHSHCACLFDVGDHVVIFSLVDGDYSRCDYMFVAGD